MIKMKDFQNEMLDFLDDKLTNNFEICSENSISSVNKIYSPFALSLIGIILSSLNETSIDILLQKIYKKLLSTLNKAGIYNFYGNDEYFYDVDTTAGVNTFIFNYRQELPDKNNILEKISGNQNDQDGFILTWFNRSRNNVDWFVNFNVFIFLRILGYHNERLFMYLKNNVEAFLINGSRYYADVSLPLFMIFFYQDRNIINEQDFMIPKYMKVNKLSSKENILSLALRYLNKDNMEYKTEKNVLLELLYDNWAKDIRYFNSSAAFYTSTELNAAIALYLLNKMEVLKDE